MFQLVVHLVFVKQRVDQAVIARLGGQKGALIDDGPHLVGGLLASGGDGRHEMAVQLIDDAIQHFLGLRAHGGAREHVPEVLVLASVFDLHVHADLIQRFLEKEQLEAHALQVQFVFRIHGYVIRGGSQVVLTSAGRLQVGIERFPGFLEGFEISADFLQLTPGNLHIVGLEHNSANVPVGRGLA